MMPLSIFLENLAVFCLKIFQDFQFPEDICGLYERLGCMGLTVYEGIGKMYPKTYEEMLSFIKRLQAIIGPRDFVIFSVYSSVGSIVMNCTL